MNLDSTKKHPPNITVTFCPWIVPFTTNVDYCDDINLVLTSANLFYTAQMRF